MNDTKAAHPSSDELVAFAHGRLIGDQLASVETHVDSCNSCCSFLKSVPDDGLLNQLRQAHGDTIDGSPTSDTAAAGGIAEAPECDDIPPELVSHGRYRVVRTLGAGGMGVVYEAEHRMMERTVALKVINRKLISHAGAVDRFEREVVAAARLSHRNIVTAFDAEQAGDLHFLVMEFVEGVSLSELVKKRGPLPIKHACNYAMQAAMGLQHAFAQGMVHRDIKPQNLMRTSEGRIKILDFGLARFANELERESAENALTGEGVTLGTPDFIAPEQARDSRSADTRADIYSLGCTLFYLLAARPPYPHGTAIEKILAHCEKSVPSIREVRDDVPEQLAKVVETMMAKSPEDRYQTPQEVIDALKLFGSATKPERSTAAEAPTQVETQSPVPTIAAPVVLSPQSPPDVAPLENAPPVVDLALEPLNSAEIRNAELTALAPASDNLRRLTKKKSSQGFDSTVLRWAALGGGAVVALALLITLAPYVIGLFTTVGSPRSTPRVLLALPHDGYWFDDYDPVRRTLDQSGVAVTIASSFKESTGQAFATAHPDDTSKGKHRVAIDLAIGQANPDDYDAVLFIGGMTEEFSGDAYDDTRNLVQQMLDRGKLVTSICRGNEVLAITGALRGKRAAFSEFVSEIVRNNSGANWIRDQPYVESGNVITGRHFHDAAAFTEYLVERLTR